ncbi:MAG: F0F1 ATP synthase subunit epsilon [Anaerolineales bacterium]
MNLKVLLPFRVFTEKKDIARIVAETGHGSFGILPHRLDCVAALSPGILTYEEKNKVEAYVAVDEGVMAKIGEEVFVSVRNAIAGNDLHELREAVEREFVNLDQQDRDTRMALAKMENSLIRSLMEFNHD